MSTVVDCDAALDEGGVLPEATRAAISSLLERARSGGDGQRIIEYLASVGVSKSDYDAAVKGGASASPEVFAALTALSARGLPEELLARIAAEAENVSPWRGDPLKGLVNRASVNSAAAFAPAVLAALARLQCESPGEFESLIRGLKGAGVGITVLRREVAKATREVRREARMAAGGEWMADLIVTADGQPMAVLANAMHALRKAPELEGLIKFDEFALSMIVGRRPPWEAGAGSWVERPWTDGDDKMLAEQLQHAGIMVDDRTAGKAAEAVAGENGFHPVRDYLERVKWDGLSRIGRWLSTYLGAKDIDYARAIGQRWLISAVARIFKPGAKVDSVLVLEGDQGLGKSTALAVLGGPWFTDRISDLVSKDAAQEMAGVWIIEFGELGSLRRADVNDAKAFLSRTEDRFRPPWGKHVIKVPRQCVFASSVNPEGGYLKDATGARRFWAISCGAIDRDKLKADRDQLWAEAVQLYRDGHPWWLETSELEALAKAEAAERQEEDPWAEHVQSFIERRDSVSIADVLEGLGLEKSRWGRGEQMRIAAILKGQGFTRRRSGSGDRTWYYFRASTVSDDVDDTIEF